ncbi:hypothetical protein ABZ951_15750 [Streptomyces sp. NPDC046215]|uniref:Uncharacterized protein n=1 Tax=Streptomyces stramineus TaxID=173861 RepID=A0ABP3JTT0_9ACTN
MIRIIRARRLAALSDQRDRAEARIPAVQLRLAGVKAERDQLLRDFDERALLVQAQAAKLERNLSAEQERAGALAAQLKQTREELAALRTVERWLQTTVEHYLAVADTPVEVIVRDGVVHGVERSRESAKEAVRRIDPAITSWSPVSPDGDLRSGWLVSTRRLPEPPRPPHYAELQARYWPEGPVPQLQEPDRSPEADGSSWPLASLDEGERDEFLASLSFALLLLLKRVVVGECWEQALGPIDAEVERRRAAGKGATDR